MPVVGFEWYYTGSQRLEDNPYRETSESYSIVGVLVERRVGPLRLFVNGENLTDTRQSRWADPFLRPERAADGRWTVDAWAPLDGRDHQWRREGRFLAVDARSAETAVDVAAVRRSRERPSSPLTGH